MDSSLIDNINDLVVEYLSTNKKYLLKEIQKKIIRLDFQKQILIHKIKLIEDPKLKEIEEFNSYNELFSHFNALTKFHLVIPLLLYLFLNHRKNEPAYESCVGLMELSKDYLKEGDFDKSKTGGIRFITNARFASIELRKYGLLRSDSRTYHKIWELSLFGIVVAANIYKDMLASIPAEYLYKNDRYAAQNQTEAIIKYYCNRTEAYEKFKGIIDYVKGESLINFQYEYFYDLYIRYVNLYVSTMDNNFKRNRKSTKAFLNFLSTVNGDKQFSKLADAVILRKDIQFNMNKVYKILYGE